MSSGSVESLSPRATDLLSALRAWAAGLGPQGVVVREELHSGYGGLLFEVQPARPDAMPLKVGLGRSDDVDFFWGADYRWEGWKATQQEVLQVCDAIRRGNVIEETWSLGPLVIEKRCSLGLNGEHGSDGSGAMPKWLKHWARVKRRTFVPWGKEAA